MNISTKVLFVLLFFIASWQCVVGQTKIASTSYYVIEETNHNDSSSGQIVIKDKNGKMLFSFISKDSFPLYIHISVPETSNNRQSYSVNNRQSYSMPMNERYKSLILNPLNLLIDLKSLEKKEATMKTFGIKEMPTVWDMLLRLKVEVERQDKKTRDFEQTLLGLGRAPEKEAAYLRVCDKRYRLVQDLKVMYKTLEDAFIANMEYQSSVGDKEYENKKKKLIEDGIREAEQVQQRFEQLQAEKE